MKQMGELKRKTMFKFFSSRKIQTHLNTAFFPALFLLLLPLPRPSSSVSLKTRPSLRVTHRRILGVLVRSLLDAERVAEVDGIVWGSLAC